MGRPRKPTALKILHGDFVKDPQRRNRQEPQPDTESPTCPSGLGAVGRAEWKRVCAELTMLGVISLAERSSVLQYCQAFQRQSECDKRVKKDGRFILNSKGMIAEHPASKASRDYGNQCIKLLASFGLTPTSRTRLMIKEKIKVDPDEKLFFG